MKRPTIVQLATLCGTIAIGACTPSKNAKQSDESPTDAAPGSSSTTTDSSSASASSVTPPSKDAVTASLAFLEALDGLMKDFKPTATLSVGTPKKQSEADRQQQAIELAYRIDFDWKTRKTPPLPSTFGCFNTVRPNEGGYGPAGNGFHPGWAPLVKTKEDCEAGYAWGAPPGSGFVWMAKTPAKPSVFAYSNADVPPSDPPELMKRIEAAKLTIPARFFCRVLEMSSQGDRKIIKCVGTRAAWLRVSGTLAGVNLGDEASVPLADTHRDPDGVLSRAISNGGLGTWLVDADAATLKVEAAAKRPSSNDINADAAVGK